MAALTWYMTNNLAGTAHQEMSETDPGTEANASPQTGWVVSTGATLHSPLDAQTNQAAATFTATTDPDGTPTTTAGAGDCLRTTNTYSGTFAAANWTFSFCFRGVTQAGTQDGRVRFRLLRGTNPTGAGATDISGSQQQASLVTNLLTTPTQTSSLAVNPGAITVNNEYIFVQLAWERTGAGGMTTTDVAFRIGNASGAGTRVQSSNFTPTPPTTTPPDLANVLNRPRLKPVTALALLAASGMFAPVAPPEAPPAEPEPFVFATVSNARVGARTLFYQANIAPPSFAALPENNRVTIDKWGQPLSKAVPYPKVPGGRQHFAFGFPYDAGANVTIDKWGQPLSKAVPYPKVPGTRPAWTFGYPYAGVETVPPFLSADVVTGRASSRTLFYQSLAGPVSTPPAEAVVTVTIDWQQPLSRAAARPLIETGLYTPFTPSPAPQVTADEWLQPFRRQVAGPFPVHTQPVLGFAEAAKVTPDEWMRPFDRPARIPRAPQSQVTYTFSVLAEDNTVTPDKWLIRWDPPPRTLQRLQPGSPFVPRAAVLENTITPDAWMQPFYKAVPVPPVHATQPVFGYPYLGVDNYRFQWDWHIQWQGPPRYWPLGKPYQPFVPREATLENTVTPDKWLEAFKPPPRYWPIKDIAQPFVPRAAVLENTVTPDAWLFRFQGAVPRPPARHTQPFYGYPYEFAANLTTSIEWLRQWQGPPRYTPLKSYPYQPFVPRAAVLENTVTPDKWLRGFDRPTRKRPVNVTQPVLPPQATAAVAAVTPTTYWFPPLSRSVKLTAPYIGRAYYAGPVLPPQEILPQVYQFVPGPPTYVTFRKLTQYQAWVKVPGIVPPSPITSWVQSPDTTVVFRRTIQYLSSPPIPQEVPQFAIGGPADEPERVVCVLPASRVAIAPPLLREVVVPVTLRTATVPELDRVVVTLDSEVVVQSNEYRDEPCPPFGNAAGIPGEEGVVSPEGDFLLLEGGDSMLLESGDDILLEEG